MRIHPFLSSDWTMNEGLWRGKTKVGGGGGGVVTVTELHRYMMLKEVELNI